MIRDQARQAALEQLRQVDDKSERGGHLAVAIGRITLAYDLWTMQRREAAAERLVDSLLDAVELMEQSTGGAA